MKRCFVIGGGSSLNDFDFSRLAGEAVIAVNFAYKFVNPSVLVWTDPDLYPRNKDEIDRLECDKYVRSDLSAQDHGAKCFEMSPTFHGRDGFKKGIYSGPIERGYLTGICALSVAVALGYDKIYLLGFDGGPIDGKLHFHKYSRDKNVFTKLNSHYDVFDGFEIYNCSLGSSITKFPKVSFEEAVQ